MSYLAKTAHLQSEVRNEESHGFCGRGAGLEYTHCMSPSHHKYITDLQFNLSATSIPSAHRMQ